MNIYLQTGIKTDDIRQCDGSDFFYIEEYERPIALYVYPEDSINYDLERALVILYDTFRTFLFEDTDQYYSELYALPIFVTSAGYDSVCSLSVVEFNQLIEEENYVSSSNFYKHLYMQDCQAIISTIQNLLSGMEYSFISYYKMISDITLLNVSCESGIYICSSEKVRVISTLLESYFTKGYSILDMFCKILFEFQKPQNDFTKYQKLKSSNKLWGDRKHLDLSGFTGSVYESCDTISMIEALRNEVVHNGSWEQNPKVFLKVEDGQIIERYMMFPDIIQGHLCSSKNRKHFFSMGIKVNEILPAIHLEFKQRLHKTVEQLNEKYNTLQCH